MARRDRVVAEFWDEGGARLPGATREEILKTEEIIGYSLPEGLRELLMIRNGGEPAFDAYRKAGEEDYPLLPMFSADPDGGSGTIVYGFESRRSFRIPDGIVVFASEGHAWWGLDYLVEGGPAVVFKWDDEGIDLMAYSFEEFLEGLVVEED